MRFFALFLLLYFSVLEALPVSNLADPVLYQQNRFIRCYLKEPLHPCRFWVDDWSLRGGFYGDYVFRKKMDILHLDPLVVRDHGNIQMYTNAGYIILNLGKRIDLFTTLGESNFYCQTHFNGLFAGNDSYFELTSKSRFSWSAGGRWTFLCAKNFYFGAQGQFFQARPTFSRLSLQLPFSILFHHIDWEMKYQEWQGSVAASYLLASKNKECMFSPYIAFRVNRAQFTQQKIVPVLIEDTFLLGSFANLKQTNHVGFAIGTTLLFHEYLSVTAEGRWGSEQGLHINSQLRF